MAKLFAEKKRTRTEPKRAGENEFAFYDSSARPEFEVYRGLVNSWLAEFPEGDQAEMISRMRKSDNLGYQAALAEVVTHAVLIRQGYQVEIHPKAGHPTRRPDFLVKTQEGEKVAFVEVTTFGPAQEEVAQSNREAHIYRAIDRVKLPPGFRLGYDVVEYGKAAPNLKVLCANVESWAEENAKDGLDEPPAHVFVAQDWHIELKLFGGFRKDAEAKRSIASAMGEVRVVKARVEIREALQKKGSRYGEMDAPYVIVVADCKDELVGGEHNLEALNEAVFGSIGTQVSVFQDGSSESREVRNSDGYWWKGGEAVHKNVSAAILLPRSHIWYLRDDRWQPLIMRNMWATHKLADECLPLPGYTYLPEKDEFQKIVGTRMADILKLPEVWPPEH